MQIQLQDASLSYDGGPAILSDVSIHVTTGWTAVVGANGAGKSTLVAAMCGRLPVASGRLVAEPEVMRTVSLPQSTREVNEAVLDLAYSWDKAALRLRARYELSDEGLSAWDELSAGQRQRWHLAACQYQDPHVMILDEPGNHLDLAARRLVIAALSDFDGIGIIVSHDRPLLDGLVQRVLWVQGGRVTQWDSTLHDAVEAHEVAEGTAAAARAKAETLAKKEAARRRRAQRELADSERQRSASARMKGLRDSDMRGVGAQARADRAAAAHAAAASTARARLERAVSEESAVAGPPPARCAPFDFAFDASAQPALSVDGVTLATVDGAALSSLHVAAGERVWLKGSNGAGKSWALRRLVRSAAARARIFYLAQQAEPGLRLLNDALEGSESANRVLRAAGTLGLDVGRALASRRLSEGEARKLALAHALIEEPSAWLVLDEPTNHMDFDFQRQLQQALIRYPGGIVIVCHDDTFMEPLQAEAYVIARGGEQG